VVGTALCVGCRRPIVDQYVLRVAPGLDWHASCLRCAECRRSLDESCTCFVRDGRAYCKPDYTRSAAPAACMPPAQPPYRERKSAPIQLAQCRSQCSRKRVQQLKKNVKNVFLDFEKNVEKRTYSFRGHFITPVFNTQLPKVSTGESPTSDVFAQKCGRI